MEALESHYVEEVRVSSTKVRESYEKATLPRPINGLVTYITLLAK